MRLIACGAEGYCGDKECSTHDCSRTTRSALFVPHGPPIIVSSGANFTAPPAIG